MTNLRATCLKDIVINQVEAAEVLDEQVADMVSDLRSAPSFEAARAEWQACLEDRGVSGLRAIEDTTPFIQRHADAALDALGLSKMPVRPPAGGDDSEYLDLLEQGRRAIAEVVASENAFAERVRGVVTSCLASTAYQQELERARSALERASASDGSEVPR